MATAPKICIQYEADGSKITITEDTGAYDADSNDGGLGAPNNDRSDLAAVLVVSYQPYEGSKNTYATEIDFNDTYLNTQSTVFEVDYFKDGWHEFLFVYVPTLASGIITPAENSIVYNETTERLEIYDADLALQPLEDYSLLNIPNILSLTQIDEIPAIYLKAELNQFIRDLFACRQCVDCDCKEEKDKATYLREGLYLILNNFTTSKLQAQLTLERLTKKYKL